MAGPISGVVRASGALDLPSIDGSLQVTDAEIGDGVHPSATGVTLRATVDREKLSIEVAEAHWQGAHWPSTARCRHASCTVRGGPPGGAASLKGHLDNVTIKVLAPFVDAEELQATDFNLNAQYTITATEPTLDALAADVRVTEATLKSRELGVAQQAPGHITLRNRVVTLDPWTIVAPWSTSTRVTLSASARLTDDADARRQSGRQPRPACARAGVRHLPAFGHGSDQGHDHRAARHRPTSTAPRPCATAS